MRKNGFTLIEIIAIIVVIAMITLLTLPNLIGTLQKQEEKNYQEFLKSVEMATELHIEKNADFYSLTTPGMEVTIELKELIDAGLFNGKTINPETEQRVNEKDTITVLVEPNFTKTYTFENYGG